MADGEAIFVGDLGHDQIYINDIGFYFLADRPSVTRYSELYPGVATTLPVQGEIVSEIEKEDVEFIVLVHIPPSDEPNDSAVSSGVTLLDDYLRSHYDVAAQYGRYLVVQRAWP